MAGAKASHNLMVLNVVSIMREHFRGKGRRVFAENVKLELIAREYYVFPDVMATCNEEDLKNDLIMKHPSIVVEVPPGSAAVYDLNTKLDHHFKPSFLIIFSDKSDRP